MKSKLVSGKRILKLETKHRQQLSNTAFGKQGKNTVNLQAFFIKTFAVFALFFLQKGLAFAQGDTTANTKVIPVDMATGLRSNGKIFVVVAVLVIILTGLFFYLIRLDRKITRLEKGTWKDS